jgi:glycosidase
MPFVQSLSDPAVGTARRPQQVFPSPPDWRDVWIYFLLVDRFDNPASPAPKPDPLQYQGGSFAGIAARLPYLQRLGAGALWLSPIVMNPQWFDSFYGGYAIADFLRVEPRFCASPAAALANPALADAELQQLVAAAHAQGLYVIFDVVLNHAGDLFNYEGMRDAAPWNPDREYQIFWRDGSGVPQAAWTDLANAPAAPDVGPWPSELRRNDFFRRRGSYGQDITRGDFGRLKEIVTEYVSAGATPFPVRDALIKVHQYLIGKFDVDGFRIDTLMYVERDFARTFGNAMREYAQSIGKKNFLTFGEVWMEDDESAIARFVGRDTDSDDERVGVDAAIDFPVRKRLVEICKARLPPAELARWYDVRRAAQRRIVSSHGEASRFFVTFLDNHDLNERFHWPPMPDQTTLALTCLFTLQGIPCVYYGTEQGLSGRGDRREAVREVLWAQPQPFSTANPLYACIQTLSTLRAAEPALRFGRMYMRPVSGNAADFQYSEFAGGVLAYSRILDDRELVVVANTSPSVPFSGYVNVDSALSPAGKAFAVLYSNQGSPAVPTAVRPCAGRNAVPVQLRPTEVQVLG